MAKGSWIRRMFEEGIALKKKYGENSIYDLSLGNPVVDPPDRFNEELLKLANNPLPGMHRYMPNAGYPETRGAVAAYLSGKTGLKFSASEIVMTCGAAGAINTVLKAISEPGDEIVILAPYFAEYVYYIDNHGAIPRVVPTNDNFMPDIKTLKENITPKTRAILLNSPNNPSGAIYDHTILNKIGRLVQDKEREYKREIFIISDDAYRKLVYDGLECPYIFDYHRRGIMVTSHSKDLALPGERIGYIAVNPDYEGREELISGLIFCSRTLGFVNAPALMQLVVAHLQDSSVDILHYQRQRDILCSSLTEMGYSLIKPKGTFYIFPKSPLEDDVAFVRELQKHKILTVPGSGFGNPGYFRIAFCVKDNVITGSLPGFRATAKQFGLS